MKVKDLIAQLEKLPKNAQVMVWEGFNGEFHPKIKISQTVATRSYLSKKKFPKVNMEKSSIGPWVDNVRYSHGKEYEQSRKIICIEAVGPKKIDGLR